jgi:hypothetical protein
VTGWFLNCACKRRVRRYVSTSRDAASAGEQRVLTRGRKAIVKEDQQSPKECGVIVLRTAKHS